MKLQAFIDGASRGNPGASGIGIVIMNIKGTILHTSCASLGTTTNNVAEYIALRECLHNSKKLNCSLLTIHSDSELLIRHLNGTYKVKAPHLKKLYIDIKSIITKLPFPVAFKHINREKNRHADRLANQGIENGHLIAV
jgi:ribonuclease HI